jgi:DNA-binding MarR family transcriptional regulator
MVTPSVAVLWPAVPRSEPRISYLIGRLDRALRNRLDDVLSPQGLTVRQYTTLSVVQARTGLSNAQLARRSLMTPQSMNEVLAGLVERGLVRRTPAEDHGRVIRTELTPTGVAVLAACEEAVDRLESEMLAELDAGERATLIVGLRSCARHLGAGIHED